MIVSKQTIDNRKQYDISYDILVQYIGLFTFLENHGLNIDYNVIV